MLSDGTNGSVDDGHLMVETPARLPSGCDAKVKALFVYYESIRPAGRLPGRQHLDPIDIPSLLPYLMLIDVVSPGPRLRNRLLGTRIVEYRGRDFTGRWFHEVFEDFEESPLFRLYCEAISKRCAVWHMGRPILHENADYKTREFLCLPLATDGTTVDMLLVILVRQE